MRAEADNIRQAGHRCEQNACDCQAQTNLLAERGWHAQVEDALYINQPAQHQKSIASHHHQHLYEADAGCGRRAGYAGEEPHKTDHRAQSAQSDANL